jgi:hypothetical protein
MEICQHQPPTIYCPNSIHLKHIIIGDKLINVLTMALEIISNQIWPNKIKLKKMQSAIDKTSFNGKKKLREENI